MSAPSAGRLCRVIAIGAALVGGFFPGLAAQETHPAAGTDAEGQPPEHAVAVPLGRSDRQPRVEIFVVQGPVEVREYAGEELRYVVQSSEGVADRHVLVVEMEAVGARMLAGPGLEDLKVWVPAGTSLRVESAEGGGRIEVIGATGAVEIVNENGPVEVSGAPSALMVNTTNGSVRLKLETRAEGEGPYSVAIHNGSLYVNLPVGSGAEFDTRTLFNGRFESPLPHRKFKTPRGERTRFGRGGPTIHVSIHNGSVNVDETRQPAADRGPQ